MKDGQIYTISIIAFVVLAFALIVNPPSISNSPTGLATGDLETALIILPGELPDITFNEDTTHSFTISDYFDDVEGDPILYSSTPLPPNLTAEYSYVTPTSEPAIDEFTILYCNMNNATCTTPGSTTTINLNNATLGSDIQNSRNLATGKFGAGLLVENTSLLTNPGFEQSAIGTPPNGWQNSSSVYVILRTDANASEGSKGANFSYINNSALFGQQIWMSQRVTKAKTSARYRLTARVSRTGEPDAYVVMALQQNGSTLCEATIAASESWSTVFCQGSETLAAQADLYINFTMVVPSAASSATLRVDTVQLDEGFSTEDYRGSAGDNPKLTLPTAGRYDNGTIEFWINPRWQGNDTSRRVFVEAENIVIGKGTESQDPQFLVAAYNGAELLSKNISNWNANNWHHVRFAFSNTYGAQLYVDGTLVNSTDWNHAGQYANIGIGSEYSALPKRFADATIDGLRIYDRNLPLAGPVQVTLRPAQDFNTLITPIDVTWNASDTHDAERNTQRPARINILPVNDPPMFKSNDSLGIIAEPLGCDPNATKPAPERCVYYNGSFLDRDMDEDNNLSVNITRIINDVDDNLTNLTIYLDVDTDPYDVGLTINSTVAVNTGNLTWNPRANASGHVYMRIRVADPWGQQSSSNRFLFNFKNVNDEVKTIGSLSRINCTRNNATVFNVSQYFVDVDGDVRYTFSHLADNLWNLSMEQVGGILTINPPYSGGNTTVNITATDLSSGLNISFNVTLVSVNRSNTLGFVQDISGILMPEDPNDSILLSNHFDIPENITPFVVPEYPLIPFHCAFESTSCGSPTVTDSNVSISAAKFGNGITISDSSALAYTIEIPTANASGGTLSFWFSPVQTTSSGSGKSTMVLISGANNSVAAQIIYGSSSRVVAVVNSTSGEVSANVTARLNSSQQTHIAISWGPSGVSLYMNGVLASSTAGTITMDTMDTLKIGYDGSRARGTYDEMRIFLREDNSATITKEYLLQFPFINMSFNGTDVIFTPQASYEGNETFVINASENTRNSSAVSNAFNVLVVPTNDAPVLTQNISDQVWTQNTNRISAFDLDNFFSDEDNSTLIYTYNGSLSSITVVIDPTRHNVSFLPAQNFNGTRYIQFTASDGQLSETSNTVMLNVTPGYVAPPPPQEPQVSLSSPSSGSTDPDTWRNFEWKVIDDTSATTQCELTLDGTIEATGVTCTNNTKANQTVSNLSSGKHRWNVTCSDGTYETTSTTREFTVGTPSGGGGGGSGGGTTYTEPVCVPLWNCTEWSPCVSGRKNRLCTPENNCVGSGNVINISAPLEDDICILVEHFSCDDGKQNQGEEQTDCGGPCNACPTCDDGKQNGAETGVDCGGNCQACESCYDGIQNQEETGVDCGGPCNACPTCYDGIQNQGEQQTDCGGPCDACVASCFDGLMNQDETSADCGGICGKCPDLESPRDPDEAGWSFFGILLLIIVIGGVCGGLGYAGFLLWQNISGQITTAQKYVVDSMKAGASAEQARDALVASGWNHYIADQGAYNADVETTAEVVQKRLKQGAAQQKLEDEMSNAGWTAPDIKKVMAKATEAPKAKPATMPAATNPAAKAVKK